MALEWNVETFRVSLFSSEAVKLGPDDWKALTAKDTPEAEQKVIGRHTMAGPFLGGQFSLSASGTRLDCILAAPPPPDPIPPTYFPAVGRWPDICNEFVQVTGAWIAGTSAPIVRVALGAVLLAPQASVDEAYTALLGMVKSVSGDPRKMRDLLFRVNWPVSSASANGLIINRLTTWSVVGVQFKLLVEPGTMIDETPLSHFVRLEIDHNTHPRSNPFDKNSVVPIYRELADLALENAERGELP
jgi:hypothetical protein